MGWLGENWEANAADEDFEDEEKCLDYFHRFQTIRKLQEVRAKVGPGEFAMVFETFDAVKNSGYTLDEIVSTDTTTLIDREEYLQYRMEQGEEEEEGPGIEDEEDGDDESEESVPSEEVFEEVPAEMTRAVQLEEELVRQAMQRSVQEGSGQRDVGHNTDEDSKDEEEDFERVPAEMTRAVVTEGEQVRQAVERSETSMLEDEQLRR